MKASGSELLILTVVGSALRIDADGAIWRVGASPGGLGNGELGARPVKPIVPRRAEQRRPDGYLRVYVGVPTHPGASLRALAHRVVWAFHNGPIPEGMEINHKNGIRDDNRLENLEILTPSANVRHRFDRLGGLQRTPRGAKHGMAKLSEASAIEIIAQRGRASARDVAAAHGVGAAAVGLIWSGRTWRHLPRPQEQIA